MGILNNLLGIPDEPIMPVVNSVIPENAKNIILSGKLPVFTTKTIMLNKNEICHYIDKAVMTVKETKKYYQSRRGNNRVRITKNWSINLGGGRTTPTEYETMKYHSGVLYVTNQRIIFSSQDIAFEKKISDLTAIVPYNDAIGIQCGNDMTNFLMEQAPLCATVINLLNSSVNK